MLDAEKIRELEAHISILELQESSFESYAKLADLYAIRDHQHTGKSDNPEETAMQSRAYSFSAPPDPGTIGHYGGSDFLQSVAGKDGAAVWTIMDDLMDTLRAVNMRVYNSVMDKIRRL